MSTITVMKTNKLVGLMIDVRRKLENSLVVVR